MNLGFQVQWPLYKERIERIHQTKSKLRKQIQSKTVRSKKFQIPSYRKAAIPVMGSSRFVENMAH